uniref:CglA protein n=1 Tax=Fopius arisanus TaxID=64838 RepID=A0A0C9R8V8_9HYME
MAKSHRIDYTRKTKQLHGTSNSRQKLIVNSNNSNINRQDRRFVFSTPASKLRLSSAVRILHSTDDEFTAKSSDKRAKINDIGLRWMSGKNHNLLWETRWKRLRAILS